MSTTKKQRITAAIFAATVVAVTFGAGTATGRATAPETYRPYTAASSSPYSPTGPTSPEPATPAPTTPAPPIVPDVYGDQGMAAKIAQKEQHNSMSEACGAGVTWTCHVTKIDADSMAWQVTIGEEPADGDAIAQEFLDRAPESVGVVNLNHVPHGTTGMATRVGTANRWFN